MQKEFISTALTDRLLWKQRWQVAGEDMAVKNGANMKKTGSRNVGKENGGCFSCSYDRVGRAGKVLVFFYTVNGIWLII